MIKRPRIWLTSKWKWKDVRFWSEKAEWIWSSKFRNFGLISRLKRSLRIFNLKSSSFSITLNNSIENYCSTICTNQLYMKPFRICLLTDGKFSNQFSLRTNKKRLPTIISYTLGTWFYWSIIRSLRRDFNRVIWDGELNLKRLTIWLIIF